GDFPDLDEFVDRRPLRRFDHRLVDAVPARLVNHLGIVGIENQRALAFHQLVVGKLRDFFYTRRVIEDVAQIPDTADAGVETCRRLPGLQTREAEDALLGFPGVPVIEHLLVRAGRDARAPPSAAVLVD